MFFKQNKTEYLKVAVPVLVFVLLVLFLQFVIYSLNAVSDTNRNNFTYTVKIRETLEEIDTIIETAESNLLFLTGAARSNYDLSKKYNKEYNKKFIEQFNILTKVALKNTPGIDGVWFQLDNTLPFSTRNYTWFVLRNGKIIDLKEHFDRTDSNERILTPEEDPYYFEAVGQSGIVWSEVYIDADTKVKMVTISKSIYKNKILIGVVGIDLSMEDLQAGIEKMHSNFKASDIFLVDKKGTILLQQLSKGNNSKDKYVFHSLIEKKASSKDAMMEYYDHGISKTAILIDISDKYSVVITFPNVLLFKGFDNLMRVIYLIFVALSVLILVIFSNREKIVRVNKKLENEKRKLRAIIDSSPYVMLIKNLDGVYIDCNNVILDLMNIKREDLIGRTDFELFDKKELAEMKKDEKIVIKTKEPRLIETFFTRKQDGKKIYIQKYIVPLFNSDKELSELLIISLDITKSKEEQEILKNAKESAEKSTAMKSNFLANMSHEIRTPLNGVLGFIQLLKETQISEEQAEFISDAQKSSEILLNIINDILDFSKIEADKLQVDNISFNLRSVVEDVTIMAASAAEGKGIEINSLICSDVPIKVIGDPGRVKQILNNLVANAVKFTPKGEVVICVKQISETEDKSEITIEVKDSGIGIEEEKLSLIFESFTQADPSTTRKYGGTGLGLAISQKLVELMGGTMSVKSKVNEGSTFSFTLPLKKDVDLSQKVEEKIKSIAGTKILVVHSIPTDLKVINYYLSEANCIIYSATNTKEAIDLINKENGNFSAILVDYKIQISGDKEFSSIVQENEVSKNIPLILYTSLAKRGDSISIKDKGFKGYLTKPIKKQELFDAILMVINQDKGLEVGDFVTKHTIKEYKFDKRARILLVEDSELNCKLICKILNNNNLGCDIANNGMEAVEAFKKNDYDLILMDCQMPILDGYKATKEIRKIEDGKKHTPIIALTANALVKDDEKCFKVGMDDYLSKPIMIDKLLSVLSKYLKNETSTVQSAEEKQDFEVANYKREEEIDTIINEMVDELEFSKNEAIQLFIDYLKIIPEAIAELEESIESDDYNRILKLAHKIKGSSSNLRIEPLSELTVDLKVAATQKNKPQCENTLQAMKNYLEILNSMLLKFIHNAS